MATLRDRWLHRTLDQILVETKDERYSVFLMLVYDNVVTGSVSGACRKAVVTSNYPYYQPEGSEAFTATEVDKMLSGYQTCELVNITDISGTIFVPIVRICSWRLICSLKHR
jgi:hypothetical protein